MRKKYDASWVCQCIVYSLFVISCYGQNDAIITARTSPKGLISFPENASSTGLAAGKYVDGYVKKYGSSQFVFPVGDNGEYHPFGAASDATVGAYFQENPNNSSMPVGAPFQTSNKEAALNKISNKEFWDIDGANSTKLTLSWNATSDVATITANVLKNLTIIGWNSGTSRWEKIPSTVDVTSLQGIASSLGSGSITTNIALVPNTYNVYSLGSLTSAPLPVTLIEFAADVIEDRSTHLHWTTSSESNSKYFEIQQSADGKLWNVKGIVDAASESKATSYYEFDDFSPGSGQNLYRLKMVDMDESFSFSRIVTALIANGQELVIYPNPVTERLFFKSKKFGSVVHFTLYSDSGKVAYSSNRITSEGIDVRHLLPGAYVARIKLEDGSSTSHKIIINR
jgi:hypothetical protein